jgi:membrane protease YdiL (CAAX protease family)
MKGRSVVEVLAVFSFFQLIIILLEGASGLIRWERRVLGWSYFTGFLMVLVPLLALVLRKRELEPSGLTLRGWETSLDAGLKGFLFLVGPRLLLTLLSSGGAAYRYADGSLVLSVTMFFALFLLLRHLTGKKYRPFSSVRVRLLLAGLVLAFPLVLEAALGRLTLGVFSTVLWQLAFGGFAEELFYRGYIQSTVNEEYGRPWSIEGVSYGPGLLVSSALYGLDRALNTFRPLQGVFSVSWSWGFYAFSVGVFYGFIREHTGDIVGSGVANGLMDAVGEALNALFGR